MIDMPSLPSSAEQRASTLSQHGMRFLGTQFENPLTPLDSYLNELITSLASEKYTVFYTTTPPSSQHYEQIQHVDQVYEMDEPYPSGMHTDLKRDVFAHATASNGTSRGNLDYNLPLFEKYQFLSSGEPLQSMLC